MPRLRSPKLWIKFSVVIFLTIIGSILLIEFFRYLLTSRFLSQNLESNPIDFQNAKIAFGLNPPYSKPVETGFEPSQTAQLQPGTPDPAWPYLLLDLTVWLD